MKYVAKFKLDSKYFRNDFRSTIVSFFKTSLSKYMDGYFYDEYYGQTKRKNLTWSLGFVKPSFQGNRIILESDTVEMTFRTDDDKTALVYYSAILGMKNVPFKIEDNTMTLTGIKLVNDSEITSELVVFKILSPICLRRHDRISNRDEYICIEDNDFLLELSEKLKEDINLFDKEIDELYFDTGNLKKTIVHSYGQKIPVTVGTMVVKGDIKLLNKIKARGIGSKRNSGFGLIEPIIK